MSHDRPPVCDYEGSRYQTEFWDQGGREYEDRAEAIALRRLLPPGGRLLLEVGAGAGRNTPRYHHFDRIVLLDYSVTQLQQAQARLGRSDRYVYVAADVYRLPFVPGLFDAATMIRVIHHMADAPAALAQIRETLRAPGGAFVLEFANKRNLKAIGRWLLGRQAWSPFAPEPVEYIPLNFDFHPRTMREWLQANRFAVRRTLTVSHFRLGLLKRTVPAGLLATLDGWFQPTGRLWQYSPSVFIRAETTGETPAPTPDQFFRCPKCRSTELSERGDHLHCSGCGRRWAVRDGIHHFKESM